LGAELWAIAGDARDTAVKAVAARRVAAKRLSRTAVDTLTLRNTFSLSEGMTFDAPVLKPSREVIAVTSSYPYIVTIN
jgi:hypothetical protein